MLSCNIGNYLIKRQSERHIKIAIMTLLLKVMKIHWFILIHNFFIHLTEKKIKSFSPGDWLCLHLKLHVHRLPRNKLFIDYSYFYDREKKNHGCLVHNSPPGSHDVIYLVSIVIKKIKKSKFLKTNCTIQKVFQSRVKMVKELFSQNPSFQRYGPYTFLLIKAVK